MLIISPLKNISPDSISFIPIIDSTTSFWPLPSTPAIPSISDSKTLKETSVKSFLPSTVSEVRFFKSNITFCFFSALLGGGVGKLFPIIISANSVLLTLSLFTESINLPALITLIASAISRTSSSLCDIKIIVTPFSFKLLRFLNNSLTSCGTKTAVGSSRINIFAPLNKTLIISTLCFSPTLNSSTNMSKSISKEYVLMTSCIDFLYFLRPKFLSEGLSIPRIIFSRTVKFFANIKC